MSKSSGKKAVMKALSMEKFSHSAAEGMHKRGQRGFLLKHFKEHEGEITAEAKQKHHMKEISFGKWVTAIMDDPSFPGGHEALQMLGDLNRKLTDDHMIYVKAALDFMPMVLGEARPWMSQGGVWGFGFRV